MYKGEKIIKDIYETYVEWLEAEKTYYDINGCEYPEELERRLDEMGMLEDEGEEGCPLNCQCQVCRNIEF